LVLIAALYVVGIVSHGILRHLVQTAPVWPVVILGMEHRLRSQSGSLLTRQRARRQKEPNFPQSLLVGSFTRPVLEKRAAERLINPTLREAERFGVTKSMVRKLPGRVESRIANSPLRVGAQTCTRHLAFRESQGGLHFSKMEERFSATGRGEDSRKTQPNATISAR
jgi:hypothetical protein